MKTTETSPWKKTDVVENQTPEYTSQFPRLQEAAKPSLRVDEFAMVKGQGRKKVDTIETQNPPAQESSSWFSWIGWPFR